MLQEYHRTFNVHALKEINRHVDVPNPSLGVGGAEQLRSQPIKIIYEPVPQKALFDKIKTVEDASPKSMSQQVSQGNFPNSGWLGNYYEAGY